MIYDSAGLPLIEAHQAACSAEAAASDAMIAYLASGGRDKAEMERLLKQQEAAHDTAMKAWQAMQAFKMS